MADINRCFLVFYVTHPDEATARRIAEALMAEKLVACSNIFPVQSIYEWNNAPVHESEWVSVLK